MSHMCALNGGKVNVCVCNGVCWGHFRSVASVNFCIGVAAIDRAACDDQDNLQEYAVCQ